MHPLNFRAPLADYELQASDLFARWLAGDDAAVIRAADGRVVATTDLLIENRHSRRDWSSATDVGRKAAAI